MATTKLFAIKTTEVKALAYIANPEKTDNGRLIFTYGCSSDPAQASKDFEAVRAGGTGLNTVLSQHYIQSFKPCEITPERALEVGKELCEKFLKGEYQYFLAVHTDTDHIHLHCIFNNVSRANGRTFESNTLFHEYYCQWLVIYKEGSVRGVTMQKYHLTAEWVKKLIPDVKLCDFDRITYQQLINDYAETHERQTTMDFHHQLKGAILDAVDDGLIARDPTRKVIIKGKSPNDKKKKYLSRYELQKLLTSLDLNSGLNMDWLILLIAKTGMRFSEAIAVTPMDFDFTHQTLSVNKTWDYKGEGGFQPTKNKSSVRKIRLDWQTVGQFYAIVRELNDTAPIFVSKEKKIYNSTLNDVLERHCKAVGIPTISVHGLRHTHASLLLFDGVSIASVAQRLGHSSINTTQKTYLHIIRELENKDIDLIMKSISSLLD